MKTVMLPSPILTITLIALFSGLGINLVFAGSSDDQTSRVINQSNSPQAASRNISSDSTSEEKEHEEETRAVPHHRGSLEDH